MGFPKSLLSKVPKDCRDKIDLKACWKDEDEWVIVLKDGWCFFNKEQHIQGHYMNELGAMYIQKCNCSDCQAALSRKK